MSPILLWCACIFLEVSEYRFLSVPHHPSFLVTLVFVSEKMKHAVDDQSVQLLLDGVPKFLRLGQRSGIGDYDVPQMRRN